MAGDGCDLLCLDLPRAEAKRTQLDVAGAEAAAARATCHRPGLRLLRE